MEDAVTKLFGFGFLAGSLTTILALIILDWMRLRKEKN